MMRSHGKATDESQNKGKQNSKKRKQAFPYGNYKSYYGYRIGQGLDEDRRLKVFRKEWFEGRERLDIGCNNGLITIQIAQKFGCRSILGVDIDSDRVEYAYWNLRKTVRLKSAGNTPAKASKLKNKDHEDNLENSVTVSSNEDTEGISYELSSLGKRDLFGVVSFKRENFVQSPHPPDKQYDTILCGILVLEPQPWKSYESNRLVSETAAINYRSIMFRPEQFQEILLDKIGFRAVEDVTSGLSGSKTGFNRPVLVFQK